MTGVSHIPSRPVALRLTLLVAVIAAALLGVMITAGNQYWREIVREQIDARLSAVAESRRDMVLAHLGQWRQLVALLADNGEYRGLLDDLAKERPATANGTFSQSSLDGFVNQGAILSAVLADRTGRVRLASKGADPSGELADDPVFQGGLTGPHIGQPRRAGDHFEVVLAAPLMGFDTPRQNIGVLRITVNVSPLAAALRDTTGLGQTGEVLLGVREGGQVRYLFPPRDREDTLTLPVGDAPAMAAASEGRERLERNRDYRGQPVLAAGRPVGYGGWGLVAKMDEAEAYAPIVRALRYGLGLGVIIALVGLAAAYGLARQGLFDRERPAAGRLDGTLGKVARICALAVVLLGLAVLAGWALKLEPLKTVLPGLVSMKPNTALGFVLAGAALALRQRAGFRRALALGAMVLGGLSLAQDLTGANFGIDQLFFAEVSDPAHTVHPGRMSAVTAVNFLLLGSALLLLGTRPTWLRRTQEGLVLLASAMALVALVGYAYGTREFYRLPGFGSVALHTAAAFLLLALGILCARADGLARVFAGPGFGGQIARRFLPLAIVTPLALGWLVLMGEQAGLFTSTQKTAVFTSSMVVVLSVLVWRNALSLETADAERTQAEAALRENEERMRTLGDNIPGGAIYQLVAPPGGRARYAYMSGGIEGFLGIPAARVMADPQAFWQLLVEDDRPRFEAAQAVSAREMTLFDCEFRQRAASGEVKWLHARSTPRRLADGSLLWDGVVTDITERKRIEEQLLRANRRLALLSEASTGLLGSEDPVVFLGLLFRWLAELLDVEACVYFVQEDKASLRLVLHHGIAEEATASFRRLAFGQGVCGVAAAERKPVTLENVQASSDEMTAIARRLGFDAYTCLPLVARGRLLGTLSFATARRNRFEEEEMALFTSLADEVAMALARQQAEAALGAERTLLRTLLDLLPDPIYIKDRTSRFIMANEACSLAMGAGSPDALIGKSDADFYSAEQAAVFRVDEERIFAGGTLAEKEERIQFPNGNLGVILTTKKPLHDATGRITGLVGIGRNITGRKRAEDGLRASEERLRLVIDLVPHFIFAKDLEGRFIFANRALAQTVGMTPEELVGRSDSELVSDAAQVAHFRSDDREVIGSGRPKVIAEEPHTDASGRNRILQTTKVPFTVPETGAPAVLGVSVDITARKQAEEEVRRLNTELEQRVLHRTAQLEDANREIESFSYSVSHDLRAPLRAIDGFSRILLQDHAGRLDDEGRRVAGIISLEAQRMGTLIDKLLDFSRLGRKAVALAEVDMHALAREAFAEASDDTGDRKIEFRLDELPPAAGDSTLLRQVWVNLFSNAVKFTRQRASATVEAGGRIEADEVVYWVRDNGAGFDPRFADKLFGVFQRLHRHDEFEGTGVGLAVVQRIVTRHGGRIWAESALGEGAAFYFSLPREKGGTISYER